MSAAVQALLAEWAAAEAHEMELFAEFSGKRGLSHSEWPEDAKRESTTRIQRELAARAAVMIYARTVSLPEGGGGESTEVERLTAEIARLESELRDAIGERNDAIDERDEAAANFLACAEAVDETRPRRRPDGSVYRVPEPVDVVVRAIETAKALAEEHAS